MGDIAEALVQGEGYQHEGVDSSWMPPVYTYTLALFFTAFGIRTTVSGVAILVFQGLLSALTVAPLYWLGRAIWDRAVGLLAAVLWLVYPGAWRLSLWTVWHSAAVAFLLCCTLWLLWRMEEEPEALALPFWVGVLLAVLTLTDPWTVVAFVPALFFVRIWQHRGQPNLRGRYLRALTVTVFLIMPWLLRQYFLFDRPVFVESRFGVNFWLGNHEGAKQRGASDSKWAKIEAAYDQEKVEWLWSLSEPDRSAALARLALEDVVSEPVTFLRNSLDRVFPILASRRMASALRVDSHAAGDYRRVAGGEPGGAQGLTSVPAVPDLPVALLYAGGRQI